MSKEKEDLTLYQPKTLEQATALFEKFKQMNLKDLDEDWFFELFRKGKGDIGFCIRNNSWAICDPECKLFNITIEEI